MAVICIRDAIIDARSPPPTSTALARQRRFFLSLSLSLSLFFLFNSNLNRDFKFDWIFSKLISIRGYVIAGVACWGFVTFIEYVNWSAGCHPGWI